MSNTAPVKNRVPKILIVGGGYAGFYTAWKLEKHLRRGEAEVTIVDPLPYMTYQPFLPEVAAGSIEARHSVVALRRHLKKTKIVAALAEKVGITKKQAAAVLEAQAGLAYREAKNGFTIPGVGKLVIRNYKARMGRNPQTGEEITIKPSKQPRFRPGKQLKDSLN